MRRWKMFLIDEHEAINLLSASLNESKTHMLVPCIPRVPKTARIVRVGYDLSRLAFQVIVEDESYDEVPDGAQIPFETDVMHLVEVEIKKPEEKPISFWPFNPMETAELITPNPVESDCKPDADSPVYGKSILSGAHESWSRGLAADQLWRRVTPEIARKLNPPTEEGLKRYPENGMYEEIPCTCKNTCLGDCKGACGCHACCAAYGDAISELGCE